MKARSFESVRSSHVFSILNNTEYILNFGVFYFKELLLLFLSIGTAVCVRRKQKRKEKQSPLLR